MRISSTDTIAGQPALAIRELFKKTQTYGGTLSDIANQLHVDQKTAWEIFDTLCTEGYIEPVETTHNADENNTYWRTTLNGNSLAIATARKPITRQTAERLLNEFPQRVIPIGIQRYQSGDERCWTRRRTGASRCPYAVVGPLNAGWCQRD